MFIQKAKKMASPPWHGLVVVVLILDGWGIVSSGMVVVVVDFSDSLERQRKDG